VILKMEGGESLPHIKFSTDELTSVVAGDPIAVIGNPLGLEGSLSNGIVAAVRPDNKKADDPMAGFIQITAPISDGSSGSPVFNMRGEIIGMATCGFGNAQNINFAIPAKKIIKLLSDSQYASGNLINFDSLSDVMLTQAAMEIWMSDEYREYDSANIKGDQSKALLAAKSLIEKFPQNNVSHFYLGVAYTALDLNAEAIKSYQKSVTLNPGDLAAWLNLGIRLGIEGQHAQAIQALKHALAIDPQVRGAWCMLGNSLWALKDFDSAAKALRKEIALNPNDGIAWLYLSRTLYSQGEFDKDKIKESETALKQAVLLGEPEAIRLSEAIKTLEKSRKPR
jgi:tetratricopeptide (TPR) repeat protein